MCGLPFQILSYGYTAGRVLGLDHLSKIRFTLYRLSGGGFTTACSVFGVIALNFIMCVMLRDQRLGLRVRFGATKSQHVKP